VRFSTVLRYPPYPVSPRRVHHPSPFRQHRQAKGEDAPFSRTAVHPYFPIVILHNQSAFREAKADPFRLVGESIANLAEFFKNNPVSGGGDAPAGIGNTQHNVIIS